MGFQQGVSGLNSTAKQLDVIGNNIANAGTFGNKTSRAEFATVYSNVAGAGSAVSIGVAVSGVSQQFGQGSTTMTQNPFDLAINGPGFFQVSSAGNPPVYTRNGQFKLDREGYIVNGQGLQLMGYAADTDGVIQSGTSSTLQLPTAGSAPQATSTSRIEFNLPSGGAVITDAFDATNRETYNESTSQDVYDARGQKVTLTYYFQKSGPDAWNVAITANGTLLPTVTPMTFAGNGSEPTSPTAAVPIAIPATALAGGALTEPIDMELDLTNATQFGSAFSVTDVYQNGYVAGNLIGATVESNGIVLAKYSNGQTKAVGQVTLANFRNLQGLQPLTGNAWAATFTAGDPIVGTPGGNLGVLQSGALEESNVDLTAELVSLITAQRTYQANAQTIKTQDQVLQTLVNLR